MVIPKLIMVRIELLMFLASWYIFLRCLISYHLYHKKLLYCVFYEKKIYINYYFRFVNYCAFFLYHGFLFLLSETSSYDTVQQVRPASRGTGRDGVLHVRALASSPRDRSLKQYVISFHKSHMYIYYYYLTLIKYQQYARHNRHRGP